jgi:hypothetical protein
MATLPAGYIPQRKVPSASSSVSNKGQLISERLFDVLGFPKKQRKNLMNLSYVISALESKNWLHHKDKGTLLY